MREAVIVASSRTGLAKADAFLQHHAPGRPAAHCIKDVLRKFPGLDPATIDDVILGCGQPHGAQGYNIGRIAAVHSGLPVSVAGTTVNRFCSSGLQAIAMAAHEIINEGADVSIAGVLKAFRCWCATAIRIRY